MKSYVSQLMLVLLLLVLASPTASAQTHVYRGTLTPLEGEAAEHGGVLATYDGTYLRVAGFFGGLNAGWTQVRVLKGAPHGSFTIITNLYAWPVGAPTAGFTLADALSQEEAEALEAGEVYVTVLTAGSQQNAELMARLHLLGDDLEVFHAPVVRVGEWETEVGFFLGALRDTTLYLSGGFAELSSAWSAVRIVRYDSFGTPTVLSTMVPFPDPLHSSGGLNMALELSELDASYLRLGYVAVTIPTLRMPDGEGEARGMLRLVTTGTNVEEPAEQAGYVVLRQNAPNPFTHSTEIAAYLAAPEHIRLAVYDLLGREVAVLDDGYRPAGTHHYRWEADGAPSGVYLYRLQAGSRSETRRMLLVQ